MTYRALSYLKTALASGTPDEAKVILALFEKNENMLMSNETHIEFPVKIARDVANTARKNHSELSLLPGFDTLFDFLHSIDEDTAWVILDTRRR